MVKANAEKLKTSSEEAVLPCLTKVEEAKKTAQAYQQAATAKALACNDLGSQAFSDANTANVSY